MRAAFIGFGLMTFVCWRAASLRAQDSTFVDFALKDQFKDKHTQAEYLGTCCILIGSDRGGSPFNGQWRTAISDSLRSLGLLGGVKFIAHADLRGVPFFMKGFVRGKFPKDKSRGVLMDWSGLLAKAYDFKPDSSNIVVFGRHGSVIYRTAGREVEPGKVNTIMQILRRTLAPETNQE